MPYTPNLASFLRPGRAVVAGLALALGLAGATFRAGPAPAVRIVCPTTTVPVTPVLEPTAVAIPDANAADLVGIYKSASCTLTLDASGTYVAG